MGGQVQVHTILGQGSTFSFTVCLRLAQPGKESGVDRDSGMCADSGSPMLPGLRILVADDNDVNQRLTKALLERQGHQVRVVGSGQDALAAPASQPIYAP